MKVFISSTFLDLEDHRAEVIKALRTSGDDPIDMETFGARSGEPTEVCYHEIDECDVFVGVYAHRYGYCPEGSRKSITELEFDYATEKGKDRLVFLVDEDTAWLPKFIDRDAPRRHLSSFKKQLAEELVVGRFSTPLSLATLVVASLTRYRGRQPTAKQRSLETLLGPIRKSKQDAKRGRIAGLALIPIAPIVAAVGPRISASVTPPILDQGLIWAINLALVIACWSLMWVVAAWIILQARDCISGCRVTEVYLKQEKFVRAGRQASFTACIEHFQEVIADACRQDDPREPAAKSTPRESD